MKTYRIIIAAIAAVTAFSCQKEFQVESGNQAFEPMTIFTGDKTKTSLNGDAIHWTDDDVIAVFDKDGKKNEFTIFDADGSKARFEGNVTEGTRQIYAVYPYNLAGSVQGSTLKVTVPADQTPKAGSFAEEHNISVAKAAKTPGVEEVSGVRFNNVCALLKFTVPAYISDISKVTISSNTAMAGEMSIDYSGSAPVCTLAENGSKSISMRGEYKAGSTFWFVLAPVTLDGITINVETTSGTYSMNRAVSIEMTAGGYRNLGTINPEITSNKVTTQHRYVNDELCGTTVKVELGISETTKKYITNLTLAVKNDKGKTVRYLESNSASSTLIFDESEDWPYLPKGEYTLTGSYTLSENAAVKKIESTFNITENPKFNVVSHAYSSYTKYTIGDAAAITAANNCQPETIYNIQSATYSGISSDILNNPNYGSIIGGMAIKLDGKDTQDNEAKGMTWGPHTVEAVYTFDNTSITGASNCHITGLPYDLKNPATGWTIYENGAVTYTYFGADYIFLTSDSPTGSVKTPDFSIPDNIGIYVSSTFKRIRDGIIFDWTYSIHTIDNSGKTNQIAEHTGNGKNTIHTISGNGTFSSTCYNVLCRRYYWGSSGPDAQITNLSIDYRTLQ